jgi:hypothetical protein
VLGIENDGSASYSKLESGETDERQFTVKALKR